MGFVKFNVSRKVVIHVRISSHDQNRKQLSMYHHLPLAAKIINAPKS